GFNGAAARPVFDTGPEFLPGLLHRHGFSPRSKAQDASRPCIGSSGNKTLASLRSAPAAEVLDSQPKAGGQAAFVSNCRTLDAGEPLIAIRRGFVASGIQAELTTL